MPLFTLTVTTMTRQTHHYNTFNVTETTTRHHDTIRQAKDTLFFFFCRVLPLFFTRAML